MLRIDIDKYALIFTPELSILNIISYTNGSLFYHFLFIHIFSHFNQVTVTYMCCCF